MRFTNVRRVLAFYSPLVCFAGCAPPAPTMQPVAPVIGAPASRADLNRKRSGGLLLYVSDVGTHKVNVYTYPAGVLRSKLSGFKDPNGLCVDGAGNVYVTDLFGAKIVEYRHGTTKRLRTIKDAKYNPGACAIDPTTGNLAVTNVSTSYSNAGNVLIYRGATGKPQRYTDPAIFYYSFCAYDARGNLFIDGMTQGKFQLAEMPAGSKSFTNISIDESIRFAGGVQWDGTNLAVGDYESGLIYQLQIDGTVGTTVGQTELKGSNFPIGFWIQGSSVIAANDDGASVMYWNYPQGGSNTQVISGLTYPWAVAVSP